MQIEPQWIDYNGHLNMAYYNVLFDRAIDELWLQLGIGPDYHEGPAAARPSPPNAMCAICANCISAIRCRSRSCWSPPTTSGCTLSRNCATPTEGWLSATSENMTLMSTWTRARPRRFRRISAPRIQALAEAHRDVPRPDGIGRSVGDAVEARGSIRRG